ncbi:MAG: S8 family peptidase [Bdellovibrionales bacterium]
MDVRFTFLFSAFALLQVGCSDPSVRAQQVTSSFDSVKCQTSAAINNQFIVQWSDGRFTIEAGKDPESFRKEFVEPRAFEISHVQINQKVNQITSELKSTGLQESAVSSYGLEQTEAEAVWSQGFRGQGVSVAVVDSEVDVSHNQLSSRIAINNNEIPGNQIDDDNNGVVDDVLGATFFSNSSGGSNDHGSHVAGIIAADPSRGPLSGVAPEARIIPSAFLDGNGSGSLGDAILAMQYAASRGAKVINASWGGNGCADSLASAFSQLNRQGILLVVASGNSGFDIDVTDFFPASFNLSNQITVGATDAINLMPTWSNNGFQKVHLTAPGVGILSTGRNNTYLTMDGTSMATPYVAGAAAVLWSARPQATASQIKQALFSGVDVITGRNSKTLTRGRLNLRKSLDELRRIVP